MCGRIGQPAQLGRWAGSYLVVTALVLASPAGGCVEREPATEVLLEVDSDLRVGKDLMAIEVKIYDRAGDDLLRERKLALTADPEEAAKGRRFGLPLSLSLAASSQQSSRAFRGGVPGLGPVGPDGEEGDVVEQQAIVGFRPGVRGHLFVFLGADCRGVLCRDEDTPGDATCNLTDGGCGEVPEFSELPVVGTEAPGGELVPVPGDDLDAVSDEREVALPEGMVDTGPESGMPTAPTGEPSAQTDGGKDSGEPGVCPEGEMEDGQGGCEDIDECMGSADPCGRGTCINRKGGYACDCDPGYTEEDGQCVELNECSDPSLHPCDTVPPACVDLEPAEGGFACVCPAGYDGSGRGSDGCVDVLANYLFKTYLKASNTDAEDGFGGAAALSGDGSTLAIGAPGEASAATGVNQDEGDDSARGSGAVYVFTRMGDAWRQQAYLKASNAGPGDNFGSAVALSDDGDTLAIAAVSEDSAATGVNQDGAHDSAGGSGAVYVFRRAGATWSQQAYVKPSNTDAQDGFGWATALSGDGTVLAVGAAFEDSGGTDGSGAGDSAQDSGAVYVFSRTGSAWQQEALLKAENADPEDHFGDAVALSGDGKTLAVGADGEDGADSGVGGDPSDNAGGHNGAVYVFSATAGSWEPQAYLKASNNDSDDYFGDAVALSDDGDTLAVRAPFEDGADRGVDGDPSDNSGYNTGAVYVFSRTGTVWEQQAYLKAFNTGQEDGYHDALALSGDGSTLAFGASFEDSAATGVDASQDDNDATNSGAVYAFSRTGATWKRKAYIKAPNTDADDSFGRAVALSTDGSVLAIGAPGEASAATGVDDDQNDNSAGASGAVYVY